MPGRFKGVDIINAGTLFESVFAMIKPFLKKKHADRVSTTANDGYTNAATKRVTFLR